jgi:hypothetical protein
MSIQTINRPKGVGYTRYIFSPSQRNLLMRIKDWLVKDKPDHIYIEDLLNYSIQIMGILNKGGYDEDDRDTLIYLRGQYIKHYKPKSK